MYVYIKVNMCCSLIMENDVLEVLMINNATKE